MNDYYKFPDPEPELINWINYKRIINTPNKFQKALERITGICHETSLFKIYNIMNEIPSFDVGGYFVDKENNICLIYDSYYPKEICNAQLASFITKYNIPPSTVEYREVERYRKNPKRFYNIHRPNCYIIRLRQT